MRLLILIPALIVALLAPAIEKAELELRIRDANAQVEKALAERKRVVRAKADADRAGIGSTTFGFNAGAQTAGANRAQEDRWLVQIRTNLFAGVDAATPVEPRFRLEAAYLACEAKIGTERSRTDAFERLYGSVRTAGAPTKQTLNAYYAAVGSLYRFLEDRREWVRASALADRIAADFPDAAFAEADALAARKYAYAFRAGDDAKLKELRGRLGKASASPSYASGLVTAAKLMGDAAAARDLLGGALARKDWTPELRRVLANTRFEMCVRLCRDCERMTSADVGTMRDAFAELERLAGGVADRNLNSAKVQYADALFFAGDYAESLRRSREVVEACATDPSLARFTVQHRLRLAKAALAAGEKGVAAEALKPLADDKALQAKDRLTAAVLLAAAESADIEDFRVRIRKLIGGRPSESYDGLKAAQFPLLEALHDTGRSAYVAVLQSCVEETLQKEERVEYVVKNLADAPASADGAFRADVFSRLACETRFSPYRTYGSNAMDLERRLLKDAKPVKLTAGEGDEAAAFAAAYDGRGVHFYVRFADSKAWKTRDGTADRASLQFLLKPGRDADCYWYRSLSALGNGPRGNVQWDDVRFGHRPVEDILRVDVASLDDCHVYYAFIPWLAVYDRIPCGDERWSLVLYAKWGGRGARIVGGGSVHEFGRGLSLAFAFTPEELAAVREGVLKEAAADYRKVRGEWANAGFWSDPHLGDAAFDAQIVRPLLAKLDAAASRIADLRGADADTVGKLSDEYLLPLADFRLYLDGLRTDWLKRELFRRNPPVH